MNNCIVIDFESVIAPRNVASNAEIKEAISRLRQMGFRVEITSPRCSEMSGILAIEEYLIENEIEFDYVRYGIPPCLCYIANNAIPFNGDTTELYKRIAQLAD